MPYGVGGGGMVIQPCGWYNKARCEQCWEVVWEVVVVLVIRFDCDSDLVFIVESIVLLGIGYVMRVGIMEYVKDELHGVNGL